MAPEPERFARTHPEPTTPERYRAVRAATEALAAPLGPEDAALQSMPDASPAKWHLAHTTWFFETFVLRPHAPGYRALDPAYEQLFNSYYQAVGSPYPRSRRGLLSRPSLAGVQAYRRHVDASISDLLADGLAARDPALSARVELGLQHEQQHQELILTDVKHLFAQSPLRPAYRAAGFAPPALEHASGTPGLSYRAHPGGIARIGHDGPGFAFDNEAPRHRRLLEPFRLASRLVTNGEWLAFMADGGYARPELWLADGFDAAQAHGWHAPLYWERDGAGWLHFTFDGRAPLVLDEPVCHVSAYEADAYARWAGARLPGEDEWEVVAAGAPSAGNFVESGRLRPEAATQDGDTVVQLFGDVWEWTRSAYAPYPGYRIPPGALGEYNGKFMSGQLVLRGGSCLTPGSHARPTYRNFFPPGARWQMTGVRIALDAVDGTAGMDAAGTRGAR